MDTGVSSVCDDEPISSVRKLFRSNDGRPVAVVDRRNTLVGILTSDDVLVDDSMTAGQLAAHVRMTVGPNESAFSAVSRMLARNVDWVPVLRNRKLVGSLSRDCVLEAFGETRAI